jgi:hypothetical protein
MRFDIWFIALALLMLLVGQGLGEWMAQSGDHSFALVHSHMTSVGWLTLALFGLVHRAFPELAASPFALVQFLLSSLGSILFVGGLWALWLIGDRFLAIVGSYAIIAGTALFVVMFFRLTVFAAR